MSDTNNRPNPDGSLRGDMKNMPNAGYGASIPGGSDGGFDLGVNATNSAGKITSETKSEAWDDNDAEDLGEGPSGSGEKSYAIGGARWKAGSDPAEDRFPAEQKY